MERPRRYKVGDVLYINITDLKSPLYLRCPDSLHVKNCKKIINFFHLPFTHGAVFVISDGEWPLTPLLRNLNLPLRASKSRATILGVERLC